MMEHQPQDLRSQTLNLVTSGKNAPDCADKETVASLIRAWLTSLDEDDLLGITPDSLASVLWQGFAQTVQRGAQSCQISSLSYADGLSLIHI
jgi:glutamate dehydrogenase